MLEKTPRQSANNLMLMDGAGNRAVVEITPESVIVRRAPEGQALLSTNHQRGDDLDTPGLLRGIKSFGAHAHFPHLAVTTDDTASVHVLATQRINLEAPPHPWVQAGNREFNALVWVPPNGNRAADILVTDLTRFMAMFGDKENLQGFWRNLAQW